MLALATEPPNNHLMQMFLALLWFKYLSWFVEILLFMCNISVQAIGIKALSCSMTHELLNHITCCGFAVLSIDNFFGKLFLVLGVFPVLRFLAFCLTDYRFWTSMLVYSYWLMRTRHACLIFCMHDHNFFFQKVFIMGDFCLLFH